MPSSLEAARQLHRAGRLADAEAAYRRLLQAEPESAELRHLLGVLACQRGEPARAVELIGDAIARDGRQAGFHANLAVALRALGRTDDALHALERAAALAPDDSAVAYNLGVLRQQMGRHAEAIDTYKRVLAAQPDNVDALGNLGLALTQSGRAAEALSHLKRAVALAPQRTEPKTNLGLALLAVGEAAAAIEPLRQAAAAVPQDANAQINLGNALHAAGRYGAAAEAFRAAAAAAPRLAAAHYNLGNALRDLGRSAAALEAYGAALACDPGHVDAGRNRLSMLLYVDGIDPAPRFAEHRRFAATPPVPVQPLPPREPDPERRLRIGYLSSDLRRHPVARNLEPLLRHRDPARSHVIAYAHVPAPDTMSERLRGLVDGWRDIAALSDEQVAQRIREDCVDLLVILAGRFDENRPLVARWRAAPVQISFHDPATSGLREIDYLIADRHLVARDSRERFGERVLRLPSFYLHAPLDEAPEFPLPDPARPVTFASFCHPAKLSPAVLALWGRILAALPEARVQLLHHRRYTDRALQDEIRRALVAAGATAGQAVFLGGEPTRVEHLERYRDVDIALDPFPFTGSTSTFEALWMGVPVVTLEGDTMVGRWSASMLRQIGGGELVATTPDAYMVAALALAQDAPRRAALRQSLRARLAASTLCDGRRRARQVERLYRAVWRRWCARHGADEPLAARR